MSGPQRDILFSAVRDRAILRASDQRLIAPNGAANTWLIDTRRILMDANILNAVADLFWEMCGKMLPFQVGGMETAAIPLLSAILIKSVERGTPVNGFIIRKERKTYGTGSLIEGALTEAPIIIVDDILNSGNSMEKVRVILEHEKRNISSVFVLIDYCRNQSKGWREQHKVPVFSLLTLSELGLKIGGSTSKPLQSVFQNIWNFASPDPNFYHRVPKSFPVTDGRRVYFGSDNGTMWCLNAENGSVVWTFKVNAYGHKNIWSAPAVYDGKLFFGSYDGNIYCLNTVSGEEIWRCIGADWVGSSPTLAPDLGLLYIGLEYAVEGKRGGIAALDLKTGEKVWEHPTKRYTHASPVYWPERQLVACGSNDNEMFLFDAKTGAMRWRFVTRSARGKGSIRHAPAFDTKRGHLVMGCADGVIYIIDLETGKEVWSVQTDNTIYTVPLVLEDTAYVGSADKYLYILDLEHKAVKKKLYVGSMIFGPPRLLEGRVYFGACNGIIYEIDPTTLNVTGTHQLPDAVTNRLTYSAETKLFYALTYMNQLYALKHL